MADKQLLLQCLSAYSEKNMDSRQDIRGDVNRLPAECSVSFVTYLCVRWDSRS
jgi:hypothetical protein